jgi:anti-sigma factor RsiW
MQHLDEGTIHSWLDGELTGDEAARVDAHIKECPECAAAVAEARGFIAASSRILTALDNAPRGVIPAAAPKRRIDPLVWRIAATAMVVAVGTLMVFRNDGKQAETAADTAPEPLKAVAPVFGDGGESMRTTPEPAPPITIPANPSGGMPRDNSQASIASRGQSAATTIASGAPSTLAKKPAQDQRAENTALERRAMEGKGADSVGRQNAVTSGYAGLAAATAPEAPLALRGSAVAMDAAVEEGPLKVVGTPRAPGVKVTLYEIAPGDTVTLTEPTANYLSAVVVTGAASAPMRAREKAVAPPSVARVDTANAAAADSQRTAAFQPARKPSAPAPVRQVEVTNGVTTISWADARTGNVLKLSGRMPEARLQQIKIRIERERAAAAKKTP